MICRTLLFILRVLTSAPTGPLLQSHHHEKSKLLTSQTAPSGASTQLAGTRGHIARFTNRTIQALRQKDLLVCYRKRSRSQVLSLSESTWLFQARDGLCSARILRDCGTNVVQLQIGAANSGRHLRDQSRTIVPSRGVLAARCHRLFTHQRSPCLVFL
jgi:hypothetical protein